MISTNSISTKLGAAFAASALLLACGSDEAADTDTADTAAPDVSDVDTTDAAPDAVDTIDSVDAVDAVDTADATDADTGPLPLEPCDPIDPSHCLYPFPSNVYLVPDLSRQTGYTLDFGNALPRNLDDKPMDTVPYRRMDGYGVGTPLLVSFPELDRTGLATEFDTAPSLAADAPILWFEQTETGFRRVAYFVDDDTTDPDPVTKTLIVRPAEILREDTRYIVAFRGLKNTRGEVYPASEAFAAYRAGTTAGTPLAKRQASFDAVFTDLAGQGVDKANLQLAWDYHTASCDALHGPVRHMIADAFATTGDKGPVLGDIEVEVLDHETWALEIRGTFEVPHYMEPAPMNRSTGTVWRFHYGPDGKPAQSGTRKAPFWIRIPKSAIPAEGEAAIPHGIAMYGHGQNGEGTQVRGGFLGRIANTYHYVFFATDMWGMSEEDVSGIVDVLFDMSGFPRVSDRLQQGLLNHVLLARTMRERLPTLPEITAKGIVLDPTRLYYTGISQGGIFGASVVALSPDLQRGHLGVPGNNYGFLLTRSRNFDPFFLALSGGYPERWQQLSVLAAIMQLWEGADPVSYMRHLHAEPFEGQGPNEVLLAPAKGDVQVAVSSNEWLARSNIGIAVMTPYDTVRTAPSGAETATYPRTGSGIVLYDFGNPWPNPSENRPPTSDAADPHGKPRQEDHHSRQLIHFLETGEIIDVCSEDGTPGCTPQ